MASSLIVSRSQNIVTATLNRPEKLNALNKEIFDELERLVDVLETDKTARVLVITGSGDKAFCVGADLKERRGMNEKNILQRLEWVRGLYPRFEKLPMPVVAAVNGMALGGGTELSLVADIRIASENAVFGLPEVGLAIIPGTGGTQRLPRLVGLAKATEFVLTAKRVSAQEALACGLVNQVVEKGKALEAATEFAESLLSAGPLALGQAKLALRKGFEEPLQEALNTELEAYKVCLYSEDRLEGLKAFAEKRKPEFKGA